MSDVYWRREGNSVQVVGKFTQPGVPIKVRCGDRGFIIYIPLPDERGFLEKFADWFRHKFLGGPLIVYSDSSHKISW